MCEWVCDTVSGTDDERCVSGTQNQKKKRPPPVRRTEIKMGSSISFLLTALSADYSQSVLRGSTASVRCRWCVTEAVDKIKNEREIIKRKLKKEDCVKEKKREQAGRKRTGRVRSVRGGVVSVAFA